jgi:hypothetical protein
LNRCTVLTGLFLTGSLLAVSGCGSDDSKAAATDIAAHTSASPSTDYNNIPGMAMGAPPQTLSMNCSGDSCDLVFVPPSTEIGKPFGVAVGLVSADPAKAVVTVAGKKYTLTPNKAVRAGKLTIILSGAPGASVILSVTKS